jgi:universal stress protein A
MFEIIAVNADHIIGIRASGKLTDDDYKTFLPKLDELISKEGPISVYVDMEDFEGWETKAAWDDFKFGMDHDIDFQRIAIVGDKKWIEWMIRLSNIFFSADMRCFSTAEKQRAMDWLMEEEQMTPEQEKPVPEPMTSYQHIVLATDFSPHAQRAAERAKELAGKYQASLSLIHVLDDFILYDQFYDPIAENRLELQRVLEQSAREHLADLGVELGITNSGDIHLLNGPPKQAILSFVEDHAIDLVVVGSHGRHGVERLLGSVAAGIVNNARCDILTVHL